MFLVVFAALAAASFELWPRKIDEGSLGRQLEGAHCRFVYENGRCQNRGIEPLRGLFVERHDCDLWAVECLSDFSSPRAVEEFIGVLKTKADVQTCDGVRPIRSLAVRYLGNSKDRSAIAPLRELLASNPMQTLSAGASGCRAGPESLERIRDAIQKLE